jgi:hypothetical protein
MRLSAGFLVAGLLMSGLTITVHAATIAPPPLTQVAPSTNIIEVDRRCGRGFHYVRGHRNRYGHWVRGHCRRNRY